MEGKESDRNSASSREISPELLNRDQQRQRQRRRDTDWNDKLSPQMNNLAEQRASDNDQELQKYLVPSPTHGPAQGLAVDAQPQALEAPPSVKSIHGPHPKLQKNNSIVSFQPKNSQAHVLDGLANPVLTERRRPNPL